MSPRLSEPIVSGKSEEEQAQIRLIRDENEREDIAKDVCLQWVGVRDEKWNIDICKRFLR